MGRKNSGSRKGSEVVQSEEDEMEMEEKVIQSIKGLESVEEKVQSIAINGYILQKREYDKKLGEEMQKIEVQHRKQYQPLLDEIYQIVAGKIDLTDDDLQGVSDLLTDQENQNKANYYPMKEIEEYWLRVLMSSDAIAEHVHEADQKPLKHLQQIQAEQTEDGKSLTVTFHFSANEWFNNQVIKKEFELDGDTIKRSFGDEIDWKEGKNITVQTVKKRNKKKKTTTTKTVKKQSFFNLFKEIDLTSDSEEGEDNNDDEENTEVEELEKQYEICTSIYEEILPRSLEFYLGVVGALDIGEDELKNLEGIEEGSFEDEDEEGEKEKKGKKSKSKSKSKGRKRKGSHSSKQ